MKPKQGLPKRVWCTSDAMRNLKIRNLTGKSQIGGKFQNRQNLYSLILYKIMKKKKCFFFVIRQQSPVHWKKFPNFPMANPPLYMFCNRTIFFLQLASNSRINILLVYVKNHMVQFFFKR